MNTCNCHTFHADNGKTTKKITLQRKGPCLSLPTLDKRLPLGKPAPTVESQKISLAKISAGKLCAQEGDFREIILHVENAKVVERKKGNIIAQVGHVLQMSFGTTLFIKNLEDDTFLFEVDARGNFKTTPVRVKTLERKVAKYPQPKSYLVLSETAF